LSCVLIVKQIEKDVSFAIWRFYPMTKVVGYIRVSSDKQDLEKQQHLLWQYAQTHQLLIDEFVRVEISSQKSLGERRIEELLAKLESGDTLLVAELSRLGRNMLETLNLVNELIQQEIQLIFVRQPELSTNGPHGQLLLAIYGYIAQTERAYISLRTKQGLAAARAQGKVLGRPKGSKNKDRALDPFRVEILGYLRQGLNIASIMKLINPQLEEPVTYNTYRYYVQTEDDLCQAWQAK
jgi:DNA invertase Pin-like site-specific DNA recombinase